MGVGVKVFFYSSCKLLPQSTTLSGWRRFHVPLYFIIAMQTEGFADSARAHQKRKLHHTVSLSDPTLPGGGVHIWRLGEKKEGIVLFIQYSRMNVPHALLL